MADVSVSVEFSGESNRIIPVTVTLGLPQVAVVTPAPATVDVSVIPVDIAFAETFTAKQYISTGSGTLSFSAGQALGGHRAVRLGADGAAYYAEQAFPEHTMALLGITEHAASVGTEVSVRTVGAMLDESSWNWAPDAPVFLTGLGQLSQTPPDTGPLAVIGQAVSATRIVVTLQPRVFRE